MIERTVRLPCTPDRAFELFTVHIDAWWPDERRHSPDPGGRIVLDAVSFAEEQQDGTRLPLGVPRVWEPGERIVLDFFPGTDPDHPTEATITFAVDGTGTLLTVRHVPTPSSAHLWDEQAWRFEASWKLVLPALAGFATSN